MKGKVEKKIARIKKLDEQKSRKTIAILGAGMAGLVAAYELNNLGHRVVIYEASSRIGGRAWTRRFSDSQYHEFGAMRFPASHDHTRYYANQVCGLSFRKFYSHHDEKDSFYFIKNKLSTHSDYDIKLLPELGLSDKELETIKYGPIPKEEKSKQLLNLFIAPLENIIEKITQNPENLKALFAEIPPTPFILELEKLSLGQFLENSLETDVALELIGSVTGLEVWWDRAITMFLRDEIIGSDGLEEIVGGTSLLPDSIANKLLADGVKIFLRHKVFSINNQSTTVQLGIKNGRASDHGESIVDFDYVICTIPFPVLRRLELYNLSDEKMSAIRNLSYASSTKVLLHCSHRFWETSYNIHGGGSQTDLINRAIYYPSDNALDETLDSNCQHSGLHASYRGGKRKSVSDAVSRGAGVLVGSYNWGSDARRLGAVDRAERSEIVKKVIANFHPEVIEDGVVTDHDSIFWDEYEWSGGAFCFMRPGDFVKYYKSTIKKEGRLHFAGEHCSLDQGWIQGAIVSALRVVEEVVES